MLNIKKQLYDDIILYCKTNNIADVELFCNQMLETAYTKLKYGETPKPTSTKKIEKKIETPIYNTTKKDSLDGEINNKNNNTIEDYGVYDER